MEYTGRLVTGDFGDNTMTFEIEGEMTLQAGRYKIVQIEVGNQVKNNVDLADVGGLLLNDIHVDYFENVECEIDGEMKDMHEYRILVEPDSKQHLTMEKMFGEQ